jgi:hypothetical protein
MLWFMGDSRTKSTVVRHWGGTGSSASNSNRITAIFSTRFHSPYFVTADYLRSLYEDHHFKGIVTKEWSPVEYRKRIRSMVNGYPHLFGHSGLEYV